MVLLIYGTLLVAGGQVLSRKPHLVAWFYLYVLVICGMLTAVCWIKAKNPGGAGARKTVATDLNDSLRQRRAGHRVRSTRKTPGEDAGMFFPVAHGQDTHFGGGNAAQRIV